MRLSPVLKIAAHALLLSALLTGLYLWQFGLSSPYRFDLAWDEEVQLHDRRIINVHIRRSYERNSLLLSRNSMRVATEISFDAGLPFGRFSHRFAPEEVALIDQDQQVWYFAAAPSVTEISPRQGEPAFWTLQPGKALQHAARGERLPPAFIRWNVMPATPDAAALAKFDNTRLGLDEKMRHWAAYPRADVDEAIRLGPRSTVPAAQK